jgi:hypothetical protein
MVRHPAGAQLVVDHLEAGIREIGHVGSLGLEASGRCIPPADECFKDADALLLDSRVAVFAPAQPMTFP